MVVPSWEASIPRSRSLSLISRGALAFPRRSRSRNCQILALLRFCTFTSRILPYRTYRYRYYDPAIWRSQKYCKHPCSHTLITDSVIFPSLMEGAALAFMMTGASSEGILRGVRWMYARGDDGGEDSGDEGGDGGAGV